MKITEIKGAYSFLSNFYLSPITFEYLNEIWHADTVEHAFQAMKSDQKDDVAHVLRSLNAGVAKRRGRKLTLRSDWDKVKDDVMLELLRLKFAIPDLRDKLLATKNATLIEGNTWGDTYWGVCRGIGDNTLGVLLMQVRSEIKRSLQLIN